MFNEEPTAQEILREIRERPYIRIAALGGGHVSLWKRIALLYRLLVSAHEARRQVESTPASRQREAARRVFWQEGGDLGC